MTRASPVRSAWLAGATGLVGRELLTLLLASDRYAKVHLLLRRAVRDLPRQPKLVAHTVDFGALRSDLPPPDDVYVALGTTIKVAGSQQAFRIVDFDHVVATARAAHAAGAHRLAVVSALGADAGSGVFYNRVKGEMQDALAQIGFETLVIAQPSLLVGDRAALGQPMRAGELWAARLLHPVMGLIPASVRPIAARSVAQAMLRAMLDAAPGQRVLSSAQMQSAAR